MVEADVRVAAGRVLAALGEAGRSEQTIRRHQVVLERFTAFLAGRGLQHGRPQTACAKVFVKHRHPFGAFGGSSSIADRLSHHAARAGIDFPPGEVCGMHSLRGALAVAMIGNGAPVPVISAVLGHASSDTTQAYYLRFDTARLRCCALDVEDVTEDAGAGELGA